MAWVVARHGTWMRAWKYIKRMLRTSRLLSAAYFPIRVLVCAVGLWTLLLGLIDLGII